MKHLLLTTIAAVLVVGCGESQQSTPAPEAKPEPPTAKAPDISIHDAAREGNIEAVKQHLAAGTDVTGDKYGRTPLHGVTTKEITELLIAKGADVNAKTDHWGETPLDWAIGRKHLEIADILRKHGGKTSNWLKAAESIHMAAKAGHIEAVKQHLAAGTKVDAKGGGDYTPLHVAAYRGHKDIAELLIAKGAEVNAKNMFGETPLDLAILDKHTELADLLRKNGGKTGKELKTERK